MKRNVLMLVLMAICSLGSQTLYAGKWDALGRAGYAASKGVKNGWFTKKCPDCEGSGIDGWGRCGNCDGSGKVCNWVTIIIVGVIGFAVFAGCQGKKKG